MPRLMKALITVVLEAVALVVTLVLITGVLVVWLA